MLLQDLRYAFRTIVRAPGFTLIAVSCLALGIGVNSTIFSVVDGVLLQPYPYAEPDRLIVLNSTNPAARVGRAGLSYLDVVDWRDQNTTLESVAAMQRRSFSINDGRSEPERYAGAAVNWTMFGLLGMPPALGRDFGPDDDRPGAEPVVILSDELWRRRYSGDPTVIGRAIQINARPHTVIGVMPPDFLFPESQRLWVPISPYQHEWRRDVRVLEALARLKPGATIDRAATDLAAISTRLQSSYPNENQGWSAIVRPLRDWMLPAQVEIMILAMMGAVTLVLMIACANVANLLLARAAVRHREISIRAALGAGKGRIVRQLLTEAVLIGFLSAPLGVAIAWIGLRLIDLGMPPDSVPYYIRWSLDWRSVAYTIAISMLTGIIFGLAPALQASRANLQDSLKEGGRGAAGGRRARLRSVLVVTEVAMSLILLVGASLFVRSFLNLQRSASGFDTSPILTMRIYLPGEAYETADAKARRVHDIIKRIESLPAVDAAFGSNFVPFGGGGSGGKIIVDGRTVERGREPSITFVAASPHLRAVLNVPLLRGRDLAESEEVTRTPSAIINQTMASQIWPGEDPVGRRFRLADSRIPEWFTVVGVIGDFRHFRGDADRPIFPAAYVPYSFDPTINTGLTIRTKAGDPAALTAAVREQIRLADPSFPVFAVEPLELLRQRSFWQDRLFGWMFSTFGAIALLLASVGVYGVLSYSVSQRVQEIGVRVALGAERRHVFSLILGHGMKLAALGIVLGVVGAAGATQFIKTILHNVRPTDPVSFVGVALFLTLVALAASYLPARRAMAVDPIVALRNE